MLDFIRSHKKLTIATGLVFLVLSSVVWSISSSERGKLVARFDIARGHYAVLGYGLPVSWRAEYIRLLRERYGIEFHTKALCIVSESLVAYVDSYNGVSMAAANRKFGHDVFKECAEEARKNWARTAAKSIKEQLEIR